MEENKEMEKRIEEIDKAIGIFQAKLDYEDIHPVEKKAYKTAQLCMFTCKHYIKMLECINSILNKQIDDD